MRRPSPHAAVSGNRCRRRHRGPARPYQHVAFEKRCSQCVETMEMFVEAYGAEAGNIALRQSPPRGVFIGGGLARRSSPAPGGSFMRAFCETADGRSDFVDSCVGDLNDDAALIGAASHAQQLAAGR